MPRITDDFDGYTVFINHNDHPPPHYDIRGNGHHCRISIATGVPIDPSCRLPAAVRRRMTEWTSLHRAALYRNWRRAQQHEHLVRIATPQ